MERRVTRASTVSRSGRCLGAGFDAEVYGGFTVLPRYDARPGYHHARRGRGFAASRSRTRCRNQTEREICSAAGASSFTSSRGSGGPVVSRAAPGYRQGSRAEISASTAAFRR